MIGVVWGQAHPLMGTWERVDNKGRLEVLTLQEEGRGIKNKYAEDGTIRKIEIYAWNTPDKGGEGSGMIKVTAEYKKDEAGNWVNMGEGLEVPVTYLVLDDGSQLTLVLGGLVTEVWTRSDRSIVDPEMATAVAHRSWGEIKETLRRCTSYPIPAIHN